MIPAVWLAVSSMDGSSSRFECRATDLFRRRFLAFFLPCHFPHSLALVAENKDFQLWGAVYHHPKRHILLQNNDGKRWRSVSIDGGRTHTWVRSIREVTMLLNAAGHTISSSTVHAVQAQRDDRAAGRPNNRTIAPLHVPGQLACLSPYAGARAARPPPARARVAPTRVVPRGEVPRSDTAMRARVTGRMLLQFINMGKSNTRIMTMRQRPTCRMHSRYETSVLTRRGAAIPVSLNLERLRYRDDQLDSLPFWRAF
jgi:hypothetical protein